MWLIFKVVNLIYLLVSSYIWFAFQLPMNQMGLIVTFILMTCLLSGKIKYSFTSRTLMVFVLLTVYTVYNIFIIGVGYGISTFMSYAPAVFLFMLDKEEQKDLLAFVTKWFSIIVGVSIIFFIINKVIPLPHGSFRVPNDTFYGRFDNYYFFLHNERIYEQRLPGMPEIIRFSGPFLEPGHLSNVCTLILFANRYRMKERPLMWILILAVLMSYSLAGYLLIAVSLLLLKMRNVYSVLSILALFLGSWTFFANYQNGDNAVNALIFSRLEYDHDKGIVGNNRTTKRTDYFFRQLVREDKHWCGLRSLDAYGSSIKGAGFKIFIFRNGFIGVMFVALIYLFLIPPGANRRYALSFYFLMALLFIQRAYPGWYSWLFSFVIGVGIMRGEFFNARLDSDENDAEAGDVEDKSEVSQLNLESYGEKNISERKCD